jgi:predicted Zn-dependent peptidase
MGAEVNAGTDKETTSLYTRVLDRHLERAFDVLGDMLWRPSFGELEAEREVVLEEIAMYEDDPQDRVFDLLAETIFGSHPLGRPVIGTAQVIASVSREQLASFHAERYVAPSIVIAAAGSLQHEQLMELAQRFEPARSRAAAGPPAGAQQPPAPSGPRVRFLEKDTEQYHVCIGGPGIARHDERRFALRVLEGVLGGTSSSRLFQEVRERRGLAYSIFTFSNLFAHGGEVGLYLGTRPENLHEALAVVAGELARFVEDPATPQELDRSRENLKGRIVIGLESTGARMSRLGASLLGELPLLSVSELIDRLDAVTIDELRTLAGELLVPGGLSVAAVGPEEAELQRALEPLYGDAEDRRAVHAAGTRR